MAFTSSRSFSNGGGIGRRELGLQTRFTSEQHYCPWDGVLIVDKFAHSLRVAAIFCFAFSTILQDRGGRASQRSSRTVLCLSYRAGNTLSLARDPH